MTTQTFQTPDDRVLDFKARIFKVMGDPNRLKILEVLRSGEMCQCELIPILGQSQPTVSRHLKLLEDAGLISSYRDSTRTMYRMVDSHVFNLLDAIDPRMVELISRELAKKYRL